MSVWNESVLESAFRLQKAIEAAHAGFDSVGVDFSALPFEQNVAHTKEVVQAIKAVNLQSLRKGK